MNIDRFKQEHALVLSSVTELRNLVQRGIAENSAVIAKMVVEMSSKIKRHLGAEDQFLYPALAKSNNPETAALGKKFQEEMGGIAKAYMDFAGKWNLDSKVAADPEGFRTHANAIFKALNQRIQRENLELYPLAEMA